MILYTLMKNGSNYPLLAFKRALPLIVFFSYQTSAMQRIVDPPLPPIDMSLITPGWGNNICNFWRYYFGSDKSSETLTLLRQVVSGVKTVQDPVCRDKLEPVYNKCAPEVLIFLLNKGMVFKDNCAHLLAMGIGSRVYCLPNRLENLKILMKAGYQLDVKYDWQKKIILYLCACYSKDDCAATRREEEAITLMYQVLAAAVLRFPGPTSQDSMCTPLCVVINFPWDGRFFESHLKERIIFLLKALWACGADTNIPEETRRAAQKNNVTCLLTIVDSLETNRAAIFHAIEQRDIPTLKKIAQCIPFLVKNAAGDNPLHIAIKSASNLPGLEGAQSIEIIGIILRVLPQLLSETNTAKCTPLMLVVGMGDKRFLLDCFKRLLNAIKDPKSAPVVAS